VEAAEIDLERANHPRFKFPEPLTDNTMLDALRRQHVIIPEHEVSAFIDQLQQRYFPYDDVAFLAKSYESAGLRTIASLLSGRLTRIVIDALEQGRPFSAIRIGDGEANLLTYNKYPGTPELDRLSAQTIIAAQPDRFVPSDSLLLTLRDWLHGTIDTADVVGVRGINNNSKIHRCAKEGAQFARDRLQHDPRGFSGVIRSEMYPLELANQGLLNGKIIGPAHFYFELARDIRLLCQAARRIILLTNVESLHTRFLHAFPEKNVAWVSVGNAPLPVGNHREALALDAPLFLERTREELQAKGPDFSGALCLIGAGPWSELYCSNAKQLGAVAVDMGSGLDLLVGRQIRPVHKRVREFIPDWPALL